MKKKNLKNNKDNIFITEDLHKVSTIHHQKRSSNYWMRSLISWIHLMNVFLESSVFFANIRHQMSRRSLFFLLFSVYLVLWWWIVETLWRSSVIKMLSLLFLRFFFFIKIRVFYLPITKTAYQLTFILSIFVLEIAYSILFLKEL
jgi:hypothetical protein